ncbi:hypothetical protein HZH68_015580 [Vespula germanica]|uniref:Uncharacterized protein n=1 Tax=Vespula germanica TaxID=30212 RepID=A0A834MQL1_VESGE|nr:hypothetical protein HZH68_015580 [Vespula germanica]
MRQANEKREIKVKMHASTLCFIIAESYFKVRHTSCDFMCRGTCRGVSSRQWGWLGKKEKGKQRKRNEGLKRFLERSFAGKFREIGGTPASHHGVHFEIIFRLTPSSRITPMRMIECKSNLLPENS